MIGSPKVFPNQLEPRTYSLLPEGRLMVATLDQLIIFPNYPSGHCVLKTAPFLILLICLIINSFSALLRTFLFPVSYSKLLFQIVSYLVVSLYCVFLLGNYLLCL